MPASSRALLLRPLLPHFTRRTKFTAPASYKEIVNRDRKINTQQYPKVSNINRSDVRTHIL